jgi:class 3 adenylate cyclase
MIHINHIELDCSGQSAVLLDKRCGAVVDACDYNGRTALHFFAERNHVNNVKNLINNGANPDRQDIFGFTPLDLAIQSGHCAVVDVLQKLPSGINRGFKLSEDLRFHRCKAAIMKSFPMPVAIAMMSGQTVAPTRHESVSLLFANIVDYPTLRGSMDPMSLIDMLGRLFRKLDSLADLHGVQPIDTVDGCYIAATNLHSNQGDHAVRLARFAQAALAAAETTPLDAGRPALGGVRLRAGMHCGVVSACVIGAHGGRKHTLLGDAVNIASRMESHGCAGTVQCSATAAALIAAQGGDEAGAWLRRREGDVDVKGRGRMTTYWLACPTRSHSMPVHRDPIPVQHPESTPGAGKRAPGQPEIGEVAGDACVRCRAVMHGADKLAVVSAAPPVLYVPAAAAESLSPARRRCSVSAAPREGGSRRRSVGRVLSW